MNLCLLIALHILIFKLMHGQMLAWSALQASQQQAISGMGNERNGSSIFFSHIIWCYIFDGTSPKIEQKQYRLEYFLFKKKLFHNCTIASAFLRSLELVSLASTGRLSLTLIVIKQVTSKPLAYYKVQVMKFVT